MSTHTEYTGHVGQIGQRDPKDGTYRAHVGNHLACIDGGEVA